MQNLINLYQNESVEEYYNHVSDKKLVSVCVQTYQHINYIKQCLDSILMQKTNFEFEVLLGDDESTDGTREICIEYAKKYPEKIRLFLHRRENVIFINGAATGRFNLLFNFTKAKGKYIAMCEGDDYWTDPYKLQKQVDLLESNPNFSACYHSVNWLENGKEHIYSPTIKKEYYDENDVLQNILQNTICATVFRKDVIVDKMHYISEIPYGDMMIHALSARYGNIAYIDEPMATYRRHAGGIYSGASDYERNKNTIKSLIIIRNSFHYEHNANLNSRLASLYEKKAVLELERQNNSNKKYEPVNKKNSKKTINQEKAIKWFKRAIEDFNSEKFSHAEKSIAKYKRQIDYNLFEKHDNRDTQKTPKVSVIIVAYNTNELLLACLASLYKNKTSEYEVIVVDNGSNDLVKDSLTNLSLLYIKCPHNLILSEGRNVGVYFAKGKIVAFLDDDALVPENYVDTIIEAFETYEIHGFRGKVLPKTKSKNNEIANHYNLGELPFPHVCDTEGNSAFLKESYQAVKGMDPLLFGGEGLDLSYRLFQKFNLFTVIYWNKTIIYHDYAITDEKLITKTKRHKLMNGYLSIKSGKELQDWQYYVSIFQINENNKIIGNKLLSRRINNKEKYNPFISICIPTYNRIVFLKRALKNALKQTYGNYEIIIVDDGSNDGTKEYIEELNSSKINYIYAEHQGAPFARNTAVENAKGEYILWLDSDDEIDREILNEYVKILNIHNNIDIIYSNLFRDEEGKSREFSFYQSYFGKIKISELLKGSPIPNPGTLIRKELFNIVGKYDLSFKRAQDYEFWSRALAIAKVIHCPKILVTQHKHKAGHLSPTNLTSVDTSYEVEIINRIINNYSIEEIFAENLKNKTETEKNVFYSNSYLEIAEAYLKWGKFDKVYEFTLKAYKLNSTKKIRKLLNKVEKLTTKNNIALPVKHSDNIIKNNKNPFISICIPTFNRSKYLKEAIESALNQNYENYEIIIVDDGSTDNTVEMVKSINSDKIRYVKSEVNLGRPKIRNKLVTLAKSDFLLWLDDDDILKENIINDYVKIIQANPSVNIIYGNLLQFDDETGNEIQKFEPNDYTKSKSEMLRNLILGNGITFPASLIKKELFEQCGYFDEEYLRAQDYELWSRLYKKANFYKVNDIVCYYRKHNSNVSFGSIIDHSYEAKTVKKVLSEYSFPELFENFDLSNQEVLDYIYYHIALSLYNFQDYTNSLFYLNKIQNKTNPDYIKLTFASTLSLGETNLIEEFVNSLNGIYEVEDIYKDFNDIFNNYYSIRQQLEKNIKYKKWDKVGSFIQKLNEKVGYIAEVPYYLGLLNEHNNDYENAFEYYKQAVRFNPNIKKFYDAAVKLSDVESKEELDKMRNRILFNVEESKSIHQTKDSQALVSVIIPTYNRSSYLKQSIQSVLAQTYQNFEILVINDGGEDVLHIIESINDSRIKYINHKKNKGVSAARNSGLKNAKGKYIAYLDDDDAYYPEHLQTLVEKLQNTKFKVVYSDAHFLHTEIKDGKEIVKSKTVSYSFDFSKELILLMNIAPTQCFMHAKDCVENVGYFNESLSTHEDWEFWIRLSEKYDFLHVKNVTSVVNRKAEFQSLTTSNLEDFLRTMRIIFKRYRHLTKGNTKLLKAQKERENDLLKAIKNQQGASIIIVTYNSEKTIESCLKSVTKTIREYDEVVIVDNNSKDKTVKLVEKFTRKSNQFKLVKSKENLGFSEGCNVGIKNSSNPFVVLLNPDTNVTDRWLDKMISVCKKENVAAVGPVSNYAAGYQNILAYLDKNELNTIEQHKLPKEIETRFSNKTVETKLLIGFCMVMKRNLLSELGGLDKGLFLGNDDLDLSWRFRLKGYKLLVAVDTFVYHEGQVSFNTEKKSTTNVLVQESTDKLYEKLVSHYGKGNVPTPLELWGINWFTPRNAQFNEYSKLHSSKNNGVSIVIPTFNQWEYTKQTIESIKEYTDCNYEIIIVDNASTDGTTEKLKNYPDIKVIENDENLGFPKAINQGILKAAGDYILLLNNDVVVTKGWLNRMVEVITTNEKIGIVGPVSNSVSGFQLDKNAKYKSIEEMHKYAGKLSVSKKGEIIEFPRVAFLCTLIKKDVIDKIGGLDERFTPGNFEDDDFCLRSQLAGYKTVIAPDVFIHHYGSVSFKKNGENKYAKRLEINKQKFIKKWGATPEEIWLQNKQFLKKGILYPINSDLFNQSIARAFINIDDEEYDLAIENLKIALDNFDVSERSGYENITKEEILNLTGTLLLSEKELEEAKNYFELELKENPSSSPACFGLGEVFYQAEMYDESKTMYEWAVVNDENNKDALLRLQQVNSKLNYPLKHNTILEQTTEEV